MKLLPTLNLLETTHKNRFHGKGKRGGGGGFSWHSFQKISWFIFGLTNHISFSDLTNLRNIKPCFIFRFSYSCEIGKLQVKLHVSLNSVTMKICVIMWPSPYSGLTLWTYLLPGVCPLCHVIRNSLWKFCFVFLWWRIIYFILQVYILYLSLAAICHESTCTSQNEFQRLSKIHFGYFIIAVYHCFYLPCKNLWILESCTY